MRKKTKVSAGFHDNRLHYSSSRHTIYINLPPSNIRYRQHKAATQRASLIQYSVLGGNFSIRQRLDFCLLCLADERLLSHKLNQLFSQLPWKRTRTTNQFLCVRSTEQAPRSRRFKQKPNVVPAGSTQDITQKYTKNSVRCNNSHVFPPKIECLKGNSQRQIIELFVSLNF